MGEVLQASQVRASGLVLDVRLRVRDAVEETRDDGVFAVVSALLQNPARDVPIRGRREEPRRARTAPHLACEPIAASEHREHEQDEHQTHPRQTTHENAHARRRGRRHLRRRRRRRVRSQHTNLDPTTHRFEPTADLARGRRAQLAREQRGSRGERTSRVFGAHPELGQDRETLVRAAVPREEPERDIRLTIGSHVATLAGESLRAPPPNGVDVRAQSGRFLSERRSPRQLRACDL